MPYLLLDPAVAQAAPAITAGDPLTSVGQTVATLRAELRAQLGGRTDIGEERLLLWLNFAYIDLATSLELDELKGSFGFVTTPGQALYNLPQAVHSLRDVAVVDAATYSIYGGLPLKKTDLAAYRRAKNETGEPEEFFRENQLLVLYPTPKAARTIAVDFWVNPIELVEDTDSPILGREWHEVILLLARRKAFDALMEFEKAILAENSVTTIIKRKQGRDEREDKNKVVLSSVPRSRTQLRRGHRLDGVDGNF